MDKRRVSRRTRLAMGVGFVGVAATVGALVAGPAQAQEAQNEAQALEGQIVAADSANAVPDSYVVVLKDSVTRSGVSAQATTLASRFGGQMGRTYDSALNGFSVHMSADQARKLAADPSVAYVQQNQRFHLNETQKNVPSWGIDRIDQHNPPMHQTYTPVGDGAKVTAFVIDTGVRVTHKTFGGRASGGFDAIDNDNTPQDGNGHGTHVAGTIGGKEYGVAKAVKIVPVRVLDNEGSGTTEQVVAGIDWVVKHHSGPSVANMSLGGPVDQVLDDAVRNAIKSGVTFALAAGNDGQSALLQSPARVSAAITVAASDIDDNQAEFSNYGKAIDLFAPGVDITSSWNDSDTGSNSISGTSMASPHVAGAAALYLGLHPSATPAEVSAALVKASTPGKIKNPGTNTVNKLLYVGK